MDTGSPVLRRPRRKLCYIKSKDSPRQHWEGPLTLDDVDKMFDDLDSTPQYDALQSFDKEHLNEEETSPALQREDQLAPDAEVLNPPMGSPTHKLDQDLDISFKAQKPVKTSSPVEQKTTEEDEQSLNDGKDLVMSPILFPQEDEREKAEPIQGTLSNGQVIEESDGQSELQSSLSNVPVAGISTQKEKLKERCMQEKLAPPVPSVRQETEVAAPDINSEDIHREQRVESFTRGGKNINDFLHKIKQLIQSKPPLSGKSGVKAPTPATPEPEDDFLILEDDASFIFTIPTKTTSSKRQNKTSRSDKDSSTDKGGKDDLVDVPEKPQDFKKPNCKLGSRSVNQKGKKMRSDAPEPVNEEDALLSLQDCPASEQGKSSKKRRLKKAQSKESNKEQNQHKDGESRKMKTNPHKLKKSKSSDGEETTTTNKVNSLKGTGKELQGSEAVTETTHVDATEKKNQQTDMEDPIALTAGGESEHNQQPDDPEGNSSELRQILGKRKRKQTGQWWLSCSQSTDKTDNHHATVKKSKQNNKKPIAAKTTEKKRQNKKKMPDKMKTTDDVFSTAEEEEQQDIPDQEQLGNSLSMDKDILTCEGTSERMQQALDSEQSSPEVDQFLRKRKQKQAGQRGVKCTQLTEATDNQQAARSKQNERKASAAEKSSVLKAKKDMVIRKGNQKSSAKANKASKKKRKGNKRTREEMADRITTLVFNHKDSSLNAGTQIFPKVYQPKQQAREAQRPKRRRKPPGNWWLVKSVDEEDSEHVSSQSQQLHHKESKTQTDRKKQSKKRKRLLSDDNTADSSAPQGGAPAPSHRHTEPSTPKMSKQHRADVFTSETVVSSSQKKRYGTTSHPAEEGSARDVRGSESETSIVCMEFGDSRSPSDPDTPQNRKRELDRTFEVITSGPSSMVELKDSDDMSDDDMSDDDMILPSTRVHTALSISDLCAPPLRPLILQPKDKAKLTEWFKILWPTTADGGAEITPDQFDWYFYQLRGMGFQVDVNDGPICNGKILLGSHMKKPLWVDHCAMIVFNLFTSSVRVTIDGRESCYSAGQSFVVECGRAYSLQNVTAQPAVLYFTRIFVECS